MRTSCFHYIFAAQKSKTMQDMKEILNSFAPITLGQMDNIRLMNRTDTKFVTNIDKLEQLLIMAKDDYYIQEIDGERIAPYYTLYFDTKDHAMYTAHESGHTNRQKLRIRSYVNSGLNFLEVKTKNNHGRTKKKRMEVDDMDLRDPEKRLFLDSNLYYKTDSLQPALNNHFSRITLVNKAKTERLTIDSNLRFRNLQSGLQTDMGDLVIIELKRDGMVYSPILDKLRQLHIHPHGFSKYCMGSALTNPLLPVNQFKEKLHYTERIINENTTYQNEYNYGHYQFSEPRILQRTA